MSFPDVPVPAGLRAAGFVLRPIVAADAEADFRAVVETREHLRAWQQSAWPEDDFTVEANRADLAGLEERHAAHRAFTYTVLDPAGTECLGCVYVFPPDATFLARSTVTPVGADRWADVDAVVFFRVRRSRLGTGLDADLLVALRTWFAEEWLLPKVVYVVSEPFTQQVELVAGTDLTLQFHLHEPDKPGRYLVFG